MAKWFTIEELTVSETARRRSIDNTPSGAQRKNLLLLIDAVLDPARELWGRPISVTSGFRAAALNRAVGGAKNSQHLHGLAADIIAGGQAENARLFEMIKGSDIPFDQLIWEKGDSRGPRWIHVSCSATGKPRRQVLKL